MSIDITRVSLWLRIAVKKNWNSTSADYTCAEYAGIHVGARDWAYITYLADTAVHSAWNPIILMNCRRNSLHGIPRLCILLRAETDTLSICIKLILIWFKLSRCSEIFLPYSEKLNERRVHIWTQCVRAHSRNLSSQTRLFTKLTHSFIIKIYNWFQCFVKISN